MKQPRMTLDQALYSLRDAILRGTVAVFYRGVKVTPEEALALIDTHTLAGKTGGADIMREFPAK